MRTRSLLTVALCAALFLQPIRAHAQESDEEFNSLVNFGLFSTLVTTGSVLGLMLSALNAEKGEIEELEKKTKEIKEMTRLERYLEETPYALAEASALDTRGVLRDIGSLLNVPREGHDAWASGLRTRRVELMEWSSGDANTRGERLHEVYHILKPTEATGCALMSREEVIQ